MNTVISLSHVLIIKRLFVYLRKNISVRLIEAVMKTMIYSAGAFRFQRARNESVYCVTRERQAKWPSLLACEALAFEAQTEEFNPGWPH